MTGRTKPSLRRKPRTYRLEKLETRYALSAAGFDCGPAEQGFVIATTDVTSDYATEIRQLQNRHPTLNRELSRFEPERLRSRQFGGNRSESLGNRDRGDRRAEMESSRHVGRSITVMQTLPRRSTLSTSSIGEGESVSQTSPNLTPRASAFDTLFATVLVMPRSALATPSDTFSSPLNSPLASRPITILASLPLSSESSFELPQESTGSAIDASEPSADFLDVALRLTDAQDAQGRTSDTTGQSEVFRFVSLQEHTAGPVDSLLLDRTSPSRTSPSRTSPSRTSLDLNSLDRWLSQEESLDQPLRELDDLLQAISADRVRLRTADSKDQDEGGGTQHESRNSDPRFVVDSNVSGVGMILLGSGTSTEHSIAQVTAQVFDDVNQSTAAQWAVGIGVYRSMVFSGESGFSSGTVTDVVVALEPGTTPLASGTSFTASPLAAPVIEGIPIETTPSQRGAGVVFCMLGIRYLRRRGRSRKEVLSEDSVDVREGPLLTHRQRRHL